MTREEAIQWLAGSWSDREKAVEAYRALVAGEEEEGEGSSRAFYKGAISKAICESLNVSPPKILTTKEMLNDGDGRWIRRVDYDRLRSEVERVKAKLAAVKALPRRNVETYTGLLEVVIAADLDGAMGE